MEFSSPEMSVSIKLLMLSDFISLPHGLISVLDFGNYRIVKHLKLSEAAH